MQMVILLALYWPPAQGAFFLLFFSLLNTQYTQDAAGLKWIEFG